MTLARKLLLLTTMALAALALAIPASAAAYTWTVNGLHEGQEEYEPLGEGEESGPVVYYGTIGHKNMTFPSRTWSCEAEITLNAEGPSQGAVVDFESDKQTCVGTGAYQGCNLVLEETNVYDAEGNPAWLIDVGAEPANVSHSRGESLEVSHVELSGCFAPGIYYEFEELELVPTLDQEGGLEGFALKGWDMMNSTNVSWEFDRQAPPSFPPEEPSSGVQLGLE